MMYSKLHKSEHQDVIAICDEELIGKTLIEGDKELIISEGFYKGVLMNEGEILEILEDASNVNFVGEEAVSCGLKSGLLSEDAIMTIGGVKHAQFFSLE